MAKKRSIIPNVFTMSNMLMGFFAMIYASRGNAESLAVAGVLIFIGSVFDASDGAVARALNVESPIGVQLDSLADAITYGVAPGIIAYFAYFHKMPEIGYGLNQGMLIATILPMCTLYRLARFNIHHDSGSFSGLPSPAAGILIASIPVLSVANLPFIENANVVLPLSFFIPVYIIVSLLMISNVDYNKVFSDLYKKGKIVAIITILLVVFLLFFFRIWSVFICTSIYIIAGCISYSINILKK